MNIKRDAQHLLGLGYSVIPVCTLGNWAKRPNYCLTETGHSRKTSSGSTVPCWSEFSGRKPTLQELDVWFKTPRGRGLAVVTGAVSGVIALDFDNPHGIRALEELGVKPHTSTPKGGFHVLFRHPGTYVKTLNSKTSRQLGQHYPGLDIRGDGGYIICASTCLDTGAYRQLRDYQDLEDISCIPEAMQLALGLKIPEATPADSRDLVEVDITWTELLQIALRRVDQGRNNAGFFLCCQLRDAGYAFAEATQAMRKYTELVPQQNGKGQVDPYRWSEALASLHSAYRAEGRTRWSRPGRT